MTTEDRKRAHVVVVGGGFAGVNCARASSSTRTVEVTLLDRNDYHQFQPLLYQVATSMLAARRHRLPAAQDRDGVRRVRRASARDVVAIDPVDPDRDDAPAARPTPATTSSWRPDRSRTSSGRPAPSTRSRSTRSTTPSACETRIIQAFEEADCGRRQLADEGAIDFVIVGGGPTGVEVAGALSEMIATTMIHEFPKLAPRAKVHLVDHGKALLAMFADKGHTYTARHPRRRTASSCSGPG